MTEFPNTQSQLLIQLRSRNDREAWDQFALIYRPVIYRMARRRGMQDADAQDVAQNLLARVAGAIEQYEKEPGTRFRHWLRRVAKNVILTSLKRSPKDAPAGGSVARDVLESLPEDLPDTERELAYECLREEFLRAAAVVRSDVNPETWQAFELTVIQGQSIESAAGFMEKSVGTVYAARSRIMKRLRDQIELMKANEQ